MGFDSPRKQTPSNAPLENDQRGHSNTNSNKDVKTPFKLPPVKSSNENMSVSSGSTWETGSTATIYKNVPMEERQRLIPTMMPVGQEN